MDKLNMQSINLTEKNIEKIEKLFPNVVTETKDKDGKIKKGIDFEKLKLELSEDISDEAESYDFTWVGKKASIIEANTPIRKTLRPCVEESKNWENTQNIYIEGDNLDVLKLLQESYLNSIKMIYIDPPYNTGNDRIYKDKFNMSKDEYEEQIGLYDEEEKKLFRNTESNGSFHSDWCSMMYPRLKLASNLLSDDGVIFISIDDNEVDNLQKICNEIFGKENFESFVWKKKGGAGNTEKIIGKLTEFILCYFKTKSPGVFNYNKSIERKYKFKDKIGLYNLEGLEKTNLGSYERPTMIFEVTDPKTNKKFYPNKNFRWTIGENTMNKMIQEGKIFFDYNKEKIYRIKRPKDYEESENVYYNLLLDEGSLYMAKDEMGELLGNREIFDTPKPSKLIKKLLEIASNNNSVILDFFSGSATTAHAVMQLNAEDVGNRKFIMVNLPEPCDENSEAYKAGYKNISEIGKERIRRAGEKIRSEIEKNNSQLKIDEEPKKVPDIGFRVFKVDSTNMKDVYYSVDQYSQKMLEGLESNIKEDRTDLDLLYGVMLDWGLQLSLSHKIEQIDGINIHTVDEGSLIACFADKVPEKVVREIAKRKPLRVVFKDSSFKSSPEKINVEEIFKLYAPGTSVKVI